MFQKKFKHYFSLRRITEIPKIKLQQAREKQLEQQLEKAISRSSLKPDQISEINQEFENQEFLETTSNGHDQSNSPEGDSSLPSYRTSTQGNQKRDSLQPPEDECLDRELIEDRQIIDQVNEEEEAEKQAYLQQIEQDEILKEKLKLLTFDQVDLVELELVLTGIDFDTAVFKIFVSLKKSALLYFI